MLHVLMFLLASCLALAQSPPISDEVCVAEKDSRPEVVAAAVAASSPVSIRQARAAMLRGESVSPVPFEDWSRWLPVTPATKQTLELRTAIVLDPSDRRRGWLAVEAAAPLAVRAIGLDLTVLIDLSATMHTLPIARFPVLQDEAVGPGCCDPINRLALARSALHDLVDLAPPNTTMTIVPFVHDRGEIRVHRVDAAEHREDLHHAVDGLVPWSFAAQDETLALIDQLAYANRDICTDRRVLIVTDDRMRLSLDRGRITDAIAGWGQLGVETWGLSVGLLDGDASELTERTEQGGGVLLRADTKSEAFNALRGAVRTGGTVARDAAVRVTPGAGILAWRRAGGASMGLEPDLWVLPDAIPGGFGQSVLYELTLDPGRGPPSVTVDASAGSPIPGDWRWSDRQRPQALPLSRAPTFLRQQVLAFLLTAQLAGGPPRLELVSALSRADGPERELAAWSAILAK
jgi:hypothetical protein